MCIRSITPLRGANFGWPAEIQVRAQDGLFEKLAAEENLFKDVEITGLLRAPLEPWDIFEVTISG